MGKGSQTTTTSSTTAPDSQAAALYRQLLGQAQGVASTPYQSYTGELTAGINQQQQTGINNINSAAGFAQPYIQQAAGMVQGAANPLTSAQIQQYQNPYQQQVIDATMAQAAQGNAQQQAALKGNTIASGALGGNREGVAQANLASQQSTALNSQLAALNSQNYTQALSTAQQQFQANPLSAAYSLGNLGVSGQNAALTGANAQIGAGTLQQTTQQAADTANYGQFQQQQAYPFQQLQWLAGLGTGVGSQLGGTSSGSSTQPAPNPWAQYAGLGLTAAGMFLKDGGAVKGPVRGFAAGGVPAMPWGNAQGWIPSMQIVGGRGAPAASAPSGVSGGQQQGGDPLKQAQALLGLGDGLRGRFSSEAYGGGSVLDGDESAYGGSSAHPLDGLSAADYGKGFAHGGPIRGFAVGGAPIDPPWVSDGGFNRLDAELDRPRGDVPGRDLMFEDRIAPARAAIESGTFDPQGANYTPLAATSDAMEASNRGIVPMPRERPDSAPASAPVVAADDDAEPVAAATPSRVRGFAPSAEVPVVAANSNVAPARAAAVGDNSPKGVAGFGFGRDLGIELSPAARTGIVAAGLSMLASRSPNLGNAIGDGGLAGVGAYQGVKTAEAKQALDNQKLEQQAKQLADEADRAAKDLALRTRSQAETERAHRVAENEAPEGYEYNDDGTLRTVKGGPKDPETIRAQAEAKQGPGLDDDTVELLANRVRAGDIRALTGLGHGAQGARDIARVQARVAQQAKDGMPVSGDAYKILQNAAQQQGLVAAERTQANVMAKLTIYGRSAVNAMDYAEKLSEDVPRTQFVPVNKAINAWRTNTGDPKIVALGQGIETLTNEYARAIGGGHGTVSDKEHARERLNAAQTPEQLKAIISVMRNEILLAEHALPAARQQVREIYAPTGAKSESIEGTNQTQPKGRVIQNGWIYEPGQDGKMKAVGRAP